MRKQTFYALFLIFICSVSLFGQSGKAISDVIVNGFSNVDGAVRTEVQTIASGIVGKTYSSTVIESALLAIDAVGSFSRVTHSTFDKEDGVVVAFNITENPIIRNVEFIGNKSMSGSTLGRIITSKPGAVLSDRKILADAEIISAYLKKNGYEFSMVIGYEQVETDTPNISDLVFELFEPTIGNVSITGNNRTRDNVLIANIEVKTDQVFNLNKYLATQNNLASLGIFEDIQIRILPGVRPDIIDLEIYVVEAKTGSANLGANWNQDEGFGGFIGLSDHNFVGTGHRFSLNWQFSGSNSSYNFSYTNPFVDNKLTSATFGIYDTSHTREVVLNSGSAQYEEKRIGSTLSVSRPIDAKRILRVSLGARLDNVKGASGKLLVKGDDTDDDILDLDHEILADIMASSTVRALSATITRDTRFPNQLRPRQGSLYTLMVENAGLLGGVVYTTVSGEGRRYINIKKDKNEERVANGLAQDWIYAVRLKAGFSTGNTPYLDQFMVGGSETLRGFQTDQFVGAYQILLNQEIRIPLRKEIGVVGFVDIGDAWGGRFVDQGLSKSSMDLNIGYGLGLRVESPIGPLRFDYGFSEEKPGGQFTFGMGTTF